ncbi:MAG: SDR family NAD(P)-dependent oxidoreductase [Microthrixaceae bacterium]
MSDGARLPRTGLVLGGTSDIAAAILESLAEHGLERVVLSSRRLPAEEPAPGDGRVSCTTLEWDALDTASHTKLVDDAVGLLGTIDLVVCAVGMLGHHAGRSMGPGQVDEMVRTNFAGPAAALAVVAERMAEQGHGTIVVLSSVAGVRPRRSNYVYGSTKSGLDAFARGLADGLTGTGVSVLVVRAGFVRSSMTEGLDPAPFATDPQTVAAAVSRAIGRGRSGVVWVPAKLGPLFALLANLPGPLWRRVAGDR